MTGLPPLRPAKHSPETCSSATLREQACLSDRIRAVGDDYARVEQALGQAFGKVTMALLAKIGQACETMTSGGVRPDRLARRHRQAMLCFCSANWPIVTQVLLSQGVSPNNAPSHRPVDRSPVRPLRIVEPDPLSIAALLNH
jgi:hypothetical protein